MTIERDGVEIFCLPECAHCRMSFNQNPMYMDACPKQCLEDDGICRPDECDQYWEGREELKVDEPEVIERFKKAVDRGVMKETREITASIKGYADSDKLDEAIKYYQELAKERYTNTGFYERVANWLKELRDRRKEEWL